MAIYKGFSTYNRSKRFTLTDFECVKQDIYNYFNIRPGEKLMRPQVGSKIWEFLFEPFSNDTRDAIVEEANRVCRADPRVKLENVEVLTYENGISLRLDLSYLTANLAETIYLDFDKERQRMLVR